MSTTHKQLDLIVVVSGEPTPVSVNANQTVAHLIHEALQRSGNKGQDPGEWELRTGSGELIDADARIGTLGVDDGTTLFLNPRAAAGGC